MDATTVNVLPNRLLKNIGGRRFGNDDQAFPVADRIELRWLRGVVFALAFGV